MDAKTSRIGMAVCAAMLFLLWTATAALYYTEAPKLWHASLHAQLYLLSVFVLIVTVVTAIIVWMAVWANTGDRRNV